MAITSDKDKPNFLNQHLKSIIFLLGVLIFAASYFLLWQPAWQKMNIDYSQAVIKEKEATLTAKKKIWQSLKDTEEIYLSISPEAKARVLEFLPRDQELPNLYYNLDQLAKTAGYKIVTLVVNQETDEETNEKDSAPKKGLQTLKVNLSLEGSGYQNLKNFLSALENNLRIFDLESLNWDPSDTSFEVSFKTYYYLPTAESPGSSNLPGNANIGP